ncbi:MAG TPA: alpha/beta hydrolase [Terriglobia bacterium]|jgi:pimeloyl-ACP methyl ester carboxylesterase
MKTAFDQGKGPAVLLIHAFPLNHTMWEPQLASFTSEFRVVAPDVRGFGRSQPQSPWTMEEAADDINALLDSSGVETCAVAGVSMGGYIALAFWSKYPQRVRRLILANTRARADTETEKTARNEMIAGLQQNGTALLPDRMLPRLLRPNASQETVQAVRKMIDAVHPSAAIYAVMAMRDRVDFSSAVHRIQCPTMVVTGSDDVIISAGEARALAGTISGCRFFEVPHSGHLSNLENPEEFNRALLAFLRP